MRYSKEHKAATREHLLTVSGALAKEKGFAASGVDALMSAAGLTSGAFYSHFGSKNELLTALIGRELEETANKMTALPAELSTEQWVAKQLKSYLSWSHIQHPESGCALPTLGAEVARAEQPTKLKFEESIVKIHAAWQARLGDEQAAWAVLAQLVGAVLLARAMASEDAGKSILSASQEFVTRSLCNNS